MRPKRLCYTAWHEQGYAIGSGLIERSVGVTINWQMKKHGYQRVPFLVVTSQDLAALRAKRFRLGHALMSHEMNLLTLLLAEE